MKLVIENLVAISPDRDAAVWTSGDFKPIHNIVTAVDVDRLIAIGRILAVDHCRASDLRFEDNWSRSRAAGAKAQPPTGGIIGVYSRQDNDRNARHFAGRG